MDKEIGMDAHDYSLIAKAIKRGWRDIQGLHLTIPESDTTAVVTHIASIIALQLQMNYPNFDINKFLSGCGIDLDN